MSSSITSRDDHSFSSHPNIWPEIYAKLHQNFEIVGWIDLLKNNTDTDLALLYNTLLSFSNKVFLPNQRLIVYHRDTDYYVNLDTEGFTMFNLYKLLNYLDIPSEYVILLSAFNGIDKESASLAEFFNIQPVRTIFCPYQWCPQPYMIKSIDLNSEKIKSPYICLNGARRNHRMYTLAGLKHLQIFDLGMISLQTRYPGAFSQYGYKSPVIDHTNLISIPQDLQLRTCVSPTRINECLFMNDLQKNMYHSWHDKIPAQKHSDIDNQADEDQLTYQPKFLQFSLWNIITETVGEYPYAFVTEKNSKAILTKRPFVVLGGRNSLKNLRNLGFQTFDNYIDESYDDNKFYADRSDQALIQIKKYCQMTPSQLQNACLDMASVIDYNYNHYIDNFGKKDLVKLLDNLL